jgi:hypothetical protein
VPCRDFKLASAFGQQGLLEYNAADLLDRMIVLAINTATNQTEIALLETAGKKARCEVLYEKSWISQRNEAEKLLPQVEKTLKAAKKTPEAIFVVQGPGAFTALRIGVTVANILAYLYDIPILGCATPDYENYKKGKTKFSKAVCEIIVAGKFKKCKLAKPVYLQPPRITISKKPTFRVA